MIHLFQMLSGSVGHLAFPTTKEAYTASIDYTLPEVAQFALNDVLIYFAWTYKVLKFLNIWDTTLCVIIDQFKDEINIDTFDKQSQTRLYSTEIQPFIKLLFRFLYTR